MRIERLAELQGVRRRVRVCWRCRSEWPATRDRCPECAVSIIEGERDISYMHVVTNRTVLRTHLPLTRKRPEPLVCLATVCVLRLTVEGLPLPDSAGEPLEGHLLNLGQMIRSYEGGLDTTPAGALAAARTALLHGLAELPTSLLAERVLFHCRIADVALAEGDLDATIRHLIAARRGCSGSGRARWRVTAALLRQRQGLPQAAVRLARRAWACAGTDDWAALRAARVRAAAATRPGERRSWLLRAALRAPDDTQPRELALLFAQLSQDRLLSVSSNPPTGIVQATPS